MRRSELKRKRRRPKVDSAAAFRFRSAARFQGRCAVTGDTGDFHAHHAVDWQHVRRHGGDRWDPRNALRLAPAVHWRHTAAIERVPLRCLRDENFEFAFELMGAAAFDYFQRRYTGGDPRMARFLDDGAA